MDFKILQAQEINAALAEAEDCWSGSQPEVAESICQDILEADPNHERALTLLFSSRVALLAKGLPKGVERAQELIPRFGSEFERAFFSGVLRESQARYLLQQRGRHSSFVAYSWFRHAMDDFEEAGRQDPSRPESKLHWNACLRTLQANPQCAPAPEDIEEHGIE